MLVHYTYIYFMPFLITKLQQPQKKVVSIEFFLKDMMKCFTLDVKITVT